MFRLVDLDEKEKDEGPSWSRGADVMTTGKKTHQVKFHVLCIHRQYRQKILSLKINVYLLLNFIKINFRKSGWHIAEELGKLHCIIAKRRGG